MLRKLKIRIRNSLLRVRLFEKYFLRRAIKRKYSVEVSLLNHKSVDHVNKGSVIHFSIDKAATQYVKNVLGKISLENGLIPVGIHDYAFATKLPYLHELSFEEMSEYKHIFKKEGFLYSVFGVMINNINDLEKYNIIFSIRDPRDVLVSYYYSMAYSHVLPPEISSKRHFFLRRRETIRNMEIDEYVLMDCDRFYNIYNQYKNELIDKYANVGIVKYEDMVYDYDSWLSDLVEKTGLKISDQLRNNLTSKFKSNRNAKENIQKHLRKGIAGDYKNKLKLSTIEHLNTKFARLLEFFGYDVE